MAKTREEKKKLDKKPVEKLTVKNMKKRHWAGVVIVGSILGIMLGNMGSDEPTPKAEAKAVSTYENKGISLDIVVSGDDIEITTTNGRDQEITGMPQLKTLNDMVINHFVNDGVEPGGKETHKFEDVAAGEYIITYVYKDVYIKTAEIEIK